MGKILVLGASPNPLRYSYKAVQTLQRNNYHVIAVGFRNGDINSLQIITGKPHIEDVDTILLYMGPPRQKEFYDYILGIKPKRIIFNPGTENKELAALAGENNIKTVENCAIMMIDAGCF
jgi:predicted CoA-binding protein